MNMAPPVIRRVNTPAHDLLMPVLPIMRLIGRETVHWQCRTQQAEPYRIMPRARNTSGQRFGRVKK